MKTETTWSGSQAAAVTDALKACMSNKMVVDYFDATEKEVLKVLLDRAEAGHAIAVERVA